MGTNYYYHPNPAVPCPTCGHAEESEAWHIGKSSAGWCFSVHVIPERGINSWEDWKAILSKGAYILDENNARVPFERLEDLVEKRTWGRSETIPCMYSSWEEFHSQNSSFDGPNGLLRHKVDGRHCIANGEGTWDLIAGDFS